jgi:hypothetical protein
VPLSLHTHTHTHTHTANLDVDINRLSGAIPDVLDNVENLEVLFLSDNYLTSSIPSSLLTLERLRLLNVAYNTMNGALLNIEPGTLASLGRFAFCMCVRLRGLQVIARAALSHI